MVYKPSKARIPDFSQRMAETLARHALLIAQAEIEKIGKRAARAMQLRLRAQAFESFQNVPLAERTIIKKESLDLSLDTMISTETYVSKIALQPKRISQLGRMQEFYIGFADTDLAEDEYTGKSRPNVLLKDVAKWNEFGTDTIPARAHWGPAREDLRKEVIGDRKRIKAMIMKAWKIKLGFK
jgi:hypothetical protein